MSLDVTTDTQLTESGVMLANDFKRLIDKSKFPTGTDELHVKARDRVYAHLRQLPERVEPDDLTNPTQYHDAQLQYVAYLLYRRVFNKRKMQDHFKWFQEELALVNPEVNGQETRGIQWGRGIIMERS